MEYPAGATVVEEGENSGAVFLIVQGKVEIRSGTRGDHPRTVAVLGKGEVFGELAMFDGEYHMASVITKEPTRVLALSRDEFHKRMATTDPVIRGVIMQMVKRFRQASRGLQQPLGQAV